MKTRIILPLLALCLISFQPVIAQKVTYNNPDSKNVFIDLFGIDNSFYKQDPGMGFGIAGTILGGRFFQVEGSYRKGYYEKNNYSPVQDAGLHTIFHSFSGGLIFNLYSGKKDRDVPVIVEMPYNEVGTRVNKKNRNTNAKTRQVPGTVKRIVGLRGGIQNSYNNGLINVNNYKPGKDEFVFRSSANDLLPVYDASANNRFFYSVASNGFYAGLDYKFIYDVKAYDKRAAVLYQVYADFLKSDVKYTYLTGQTPGFKPDINISDNKRLNTGWRVGFSAVYGHYAGFCVRIEGGQMPGRSIDNWYCNVGLGLQLGGGVFLKK